MPTYPRHPLAMAQQAMSTQAATDGRLVLGIGPSHPVVIESMHGLEYARPAHHTREYVEVLRAAFAGSGHVEYRGEFFGVLVDAHRARLHAGADHDRRARAEDAEARRRAHRRHHHVLGQRARGRRAHRARHHRRRRGCGAAAAAGRGRPPGGGLRRRRRRTRARGQALRGVPEHPHVPAHPRPRRRRHHARRRRHHRHRGRGDRAAAQLRGGRRHRPLRDRARARRRPRRVAASHHRAAGVAQPRACSEQDEEHA